MCHTSNSGSPATTHSATTLPMPPAPAMPCAQKPAATKKPGHLGLAQAELVVGGEALRAVDHPADPVSASAGTRRCAFAGISSSRSQSSGRSRPLKSAGIASYRVARRGERGGVALVPAHDEPVDLLPVVHEQVGVAQARQQGRSRAASTTAGIGSVTTYWCDIGTIGTRTPAIRADLGRVHAAAVDDDLALDVAAVGAHPGDAPRRAGRERVSIASTRVRVAIRTPPARAPAASA